MRRFAIALLLSGLPVAVALARQPQAAEKGGAALVTVDFRVFAREGAPVLDLAAGDVTLKVGGRQREIVALQLVQIHTARSAPVAATEPAPPFVANGRTSVDGRDVVILLDDESIAPGREAAVKRAVTDLLDSLGPADRVSLLVTTLGTRVPFTNDFDAARAEIGRLKGRAASSETQMDAGCRTRRNLDALLSVFSNVSTSVPSVVVFVSNGFSSPTTVEPIAKGQPSPTGACELRTRDYDELSSRAAASRAHVYGIQVIDDTKSGEPRAADMTAGFEHVAGLSGNGVIRLIGDTQPAVKRIASDTAFYYVAAFEVPVQEQNGSTQRVEVDASRPGLTVRAPASVVLPRAAGQKKAPEMKLGDMLSAPRAWDQLSLRASVHTSRASADGKMKLVCVFEPGDGAGRLAEAGIAVFDEKGVPRAQWVGGQGDLKRPVLVVPMNAPAPGRYRLRIAARDASGVSGTLDYPVTIGAPASGVTLGDLVLGTQGDGAFAPRLQFTSETTVLGAVEIYGAPKGAKVAAVFELAATESSPTLAVLPGTVQTLRDDVRVASMVFPIKGMPPGDVVVRARVSVDDKPLDARPTKTLRKVAG